MGGHKGRCIFSPTFIASIPSCSIPVIITVQKLSGNEYCLGIEYRIVVLKKGRKGNGIGGDSLLLEIGGNYFVQESAGHGFKMVGGGA